VNLEEKRKTVRPKWYEQLSIGAGIVLILYVVMHDAIAKLPASAAQLAAVKPTRFMWGLFSVGFLVACYGLWSALHSAVPQPAPRHQQRAHR